MNKLLFILILMAVIPSRVHAQAEFVQTPYQPQKVVFDFYFNDPHEIGPALFWLRSLMNPLIAAPYHYAPEDLDLKVIIHGAEIVTLAHKNYAHYEEAVERMRYYADLGVEFKICGQAMIDYGYTAADFYDFVQVVPNAITELAHWQMQGYALITPKVMEKKLTLEQIR